MSATCDVVPSMDDSPQQFSPTSASGEEQPLESHEVIELQSFSERKAWIEEKIKFLEKMPPIEVFAGLDAVRSSAEHIPELPTQEELGKWVTEHDAIEKETEVFDRGELTKLRQLTKAATQRNLSPADTDVIELTLTTIYALDKLLHLLRDRSENLELLGTRLSWEESRIAAWVERRKILDDLRAFLESRARWSPLVYEDTPNADEHRDVKRRSSITSLASVNSDTASISAGFSRSFRFKLAELLSRDAAQFAARVIGLRHGRVSASGKILDRLIENSRKPVPEELLDEQDKLEEKGIADLEHLGKFVMNMVMQWRKADEIYVETVKDRITAQNLLEEIETANLHHPTHRQSTSFISRADGLIKRLSLRGNPASSASVFPSPEHHLFGDQNDFNGTLVQFLSNEIASTTDIARKVDAATNAYHTAYETVKRVDGLTASARELSATFLSLITRMREGVSADEGDGSPPDLTSARCLDPSSHAVFLALLPSLLSEVAQTSKRSAEVLSSSIPAVVNLRHHGISAEFKIAASADFTQLESTQKEAKMICDDIQARSVRLREARRIQASIGKSLLQLEDVRQSVVHAMEVVRWRRVTGLSVDHIVDQSLASSQDVASPVEFRTQILELGSQVVQEVDVALESLCKNLEDPLKQHLTHKSFELRKYKDKAAKMVDLLESIQEQARVMKTVCKDFNDIRMQIEHTGTEIESHRDSVISDQTTDRIILEAGFVSQYDLDMIQTKVTTFSESLPDRIIFISQPLTPYTAGYPEKRISFTDPILVERIALDLPFDLETLNDTVRSDSNSFSMTLRGQMDILKQKFAHFHLVCMAGEFDAGLATADIKVSSLHQDIAAFRSTLLDISSRGDDTTQLLSTLLRNAEKMTRDGRMNFEQCFSAVQDLTQRMSPIAKTQDTSVREVLYVARHRAMESVMSRYRVCEVDLLAFMEALSLEQKTVLKRLENLRVEEERRLLAQKERLATEEQERIQAEQEKLEREERERLEEIQRVEVLRRQAERERTALEEAEKVRLENERAEAEARQRLEEIRLADEKQTQALRYRIAEEVEHSRLKQERMAVEEKLLLVEQELAQERRVQAEKDTGVAEDLKPDRQIRPPDEPLQGDNIAEQKGHQKSELQLDEKPLVGEMDKPLDRDTNAVKQGADVNNLMWSAGEERRKDSSVKVRKTRLGIFQSGSKSRLSNEEDIFTLSVAPIDDGTKTKETRELQAQILTLRRQLRLMNINEVAYPRNASANLPSLRQHNKMTREFSSITSGASLLPSSVPDHSAEVELQSLRTEIKSSSELMQRVEKLAHLTDDIQKCDLALSDLLEHVDCYPNPPSFVSGTQHPSLLETPPEEQLTARLTSTRGTIESMTSKFASVSKDPRAIAEKTRIVQTWSELEDMALERLGVRKSRPSSTISSRPSSGRNSSASITNMHSSKKAMGYSNLSVSSHKRLLVPNHPASRRVVSGGSVEDYSRPSSQTSNLSSNRAVSSPFSPSIYGSTFASRQRTSSLNNSHSTPVQQIFMTPVRTGSQATQHIRGSSPTGSEVSSYSRPIRARTSSSASMSNWSRAARISNTPAFSNPKAQKKPAAPRKTYIADPKSMLDVAVGDVINKLPIGINIEGVSETWQDQSGKYWIGNQDPKLCFCRILRSQTVMVRVGGGWSELSKFIKDHFADSFRLLPESPPRPGFTDEKWISSATLLEASMEIDSSPAPPRTPEPTMPFVPSFALSTPSRQSPHSMKSPSNSPSAKGSPLTPLQFIRRADMELLRPITPTKSSSAPRTRNPNAQVSTPARTSIWRP